MASQSSCLARKTVLSVVLLSLVTVCANGARLGDFGYRGRQPSHISQPAEPVASVPYGDGYAYQPHLEQPGPIRHDDDDDDEKFDRDPDDRFYHNDDHFDDRDDDDFDHDDLPDKDDQEEIERNRHPASQAASYQPLSRYRRDSKEEDDDSDEDDEKIPAVHQTSSLLKPTPSTEYSPSSSSYDAEKKEDGTSTSTVHETSYDREFPEPEKVSPSGHGSSYDQRPDQGSSSYDEKVDHGSSYDQKPDHGSSYEQKPDQGSSYEQKPAHGTSYDEKPAHGTSYDEKPAHGTSYDEKPDHGSSYDHVPPEPKPDSYDVKVGDYEGPKVRVPEYNPFFEYILFTDGKHGGQKELTHRPWNVDCNEDPVRYKFGYITALWDDQHNFKDIDKVKCIAAREPFKFYEMNSRYQHRLDFWKPSEDKQKTIDCPENFVLTAIYDDFYDFDGIKHGKCVKLIRANVDYEQCEVIDSEKRDGGVSDRYKRWLLECPHEHAMVGLSRNYERIERVRCCRVKFDDKYYHKH